MPVSRRKQVVAAVIGNALEWYDFVVFGFMTIVISRLFFPDDNELLALLKATATFGVGFFMRPVGGLVLGVYADKHGRKKALQLIMGLMTLALLMIVLAPTYAAIGIAAPLLMVLARLLQGFATGGEFAIATSFLVEVAPPGKRGLYGCMQQFGLALAALGGALAGMLVTVFLTPEQLDSWGWRAPFAVGLLIGPVGMYIRRYMEETDEFLNTQAAAAQIPLLTGLRGSWRAVLVTFGLVICGTITYYVLLIYMPTFAQKQLALSAGDAFKVQVIALIFLSVIVPIIGAWSDRIGRKPILLGGAALLGAALYPAFQFMQHAPSFTSFLIGQVVLCSLLGVFYGPLPTAVAEQFEAKVRSTGLSLAYNLAVMLFGGFASFLVTWLIGVTGDSNAAAYYVMFGCAVGLTAASFARESTDLMR